MHGSVERDYCWAPASYSETRALRLYRGGAGAGIDCVCLLPPPPTTHPRAGDPSVDSVVATNSDNTSDQRSTYSYARRFKQDRNVHTKAIDNDIVFG